jgi:hypothetical protein
MVSTIRQNVLVKASEVSLCFKIGNKGYKYHNQVE